MPTHLRWVGEADLDRVALCRLRCYAPADKHIDDFKSRIRSDTRSSPGDFLLAEDDGGNAVGTATHLAMHLWARGGAGAVPGRGVGRGDQDDAPQRWRRARRGDGGHARGGPPRARSRRRLLGADAVPRGRTTSTSATGSSSDATSGPCRSACCRPGTSAACGSTSRGDFAARADCLRRANRSGQCDIERTDDHWRARDLAAGDGAPDRRH